MKNQVKYRSENVDGINIFYRESGDPPNPTILFFHGFPSSSHMYRDLLTALSASYHVIAPDYPGFGHSDAPGLADYDYSFDQLSITMERFIDQINLKKFSLFMQDYGSPVGFRIAARRPELIQTLLIQNANAYFEGLGPMVQAIGELERAGDSKGLEAATLGMMTLEGIKNMYMEGAAHPERINPDSFLFDSLLMERKGIKEIQAALFANYGTNFPLYAEWQNYLQTEQPPALILWGKNDQIFVPAGADAYQKDLKNAAVYKFDGGHFAIEEYHSEMIPIIEHFLQKFTK
ncbi:alpha/beta fold hydrolase [Mucilaginibacter jinjuensis]|uniref:Alpha/beta hydrolase n=1 Tax=Mucilaginibacter jinjuensis TaxID=1176721 RepID=A0ABY7TDG7_9SPHI|nr:alpha/beta hydrolase [Mucilaginibacter jinjuensis]WCT14284.1 alpha/beta hydrolase [Mucilaginibacter jinjuensis]